MDNIIVYDCLVALALKFCDRVSSQTHFNGVLRRFMYLQHYTVFVWYICTDLSYSTLFSQILHRKLFNLDIVVIANRRKKFYVLSYVYKRKTNNATCLPILYRHILLYYFRLFLHTAAPSIQFRSQLFIYI